MVLCQMHLNSTESEHMLGIKEGSLKSLNPHYACIYSNKEHESQLMVV